MKIKFTCKWTNDKSLYARILSNYATKDEYYELLTFKDDYDYLVIITDTFNNINIVKEKTLGIIMEPSWSSYYNKNLYKMCKHVLFHNKNLYPYENVIEWINCGFTHDIISHEMFTKKLPDNMKFNSFKHKLISFICGERNDFKEGYKLRESLTNYLDNNNNLKVDIYGKYFVPNFDKNIYGPLQLKFNGLQNYKFSVCIENSFEKNYISEKLYDCFINNVVPIYCGAPNILEIFNNKNLIKFNSLDECISVLEKINYGEILYENFNLNEAIDKYFNDINLISQVLNIFKKYY